MASRTDDFLKAILKGGKVVAGSFRPNGAGAIDNTLNLGTKGWTVARTGVGTYTITLDDGYPAHVAIVAMPQLNAVADGFIQATGAIDPTTNKTAVLTNLVGAVATEIASNANNWVHFVWILKNSQVT